MGKKKIEVVCKQNLQVKLYVETHKIDFNNTLILVAKNWINIVQVLIKNVEEFREDDIRRYLIKLWVMNV